MRLAVLIHVLLAAACAPAAVTVYPDYPDAIERDDAYRVSVTQDGATRPLVVWNHCEKSILADRTHGGDVNRRFCEFAFAGAPVRVDIAVTEDVRCYKIFPARLRLKHTFKDGVVSVWLDRPENFGLQLNDYDKSILSVLADAPEDPARIPAQGTAGVLRVDGWMDAPNADGTLVISNEVKEVYIAPGAVLNARLYVKSPHCRVHGRGIILDPMSDIFRYDQTANRTFGTFRIDAPGVTVEDVKLLDARTFNWIFSPGGVTVRNTKTFSSMMCSDGMSFWGGRGCPVTIEHCWVYSGDNGLVISGNQPLVVKDTTVGTSCAAIFAQESFRQPTVLENVNVFRSDEGLFNNYYNGHKPPQERPHQEQAILFRNFTAVDTTQFAWIFQGRNMGHKPKTFVFDNASFPEPTGKSTYKAIGQKGRAIILSNNSAWLDTDNYHLFFTNLFVGGVAYPTGLPPERVLNTRTNEIVFAAAPFHGEVPLAPDRVVTDWTCPAARRRALPAVAPGQNLVAETKKAHSVWQRNPSYRTRLEADHDRTAPVYHVLRAQPGAGMQAVLTELVLAAGKGEYELTFEGRAEPAEGGAPEVPFAAKLLSNETCHTVTGTLGSDWQARSFTLRGPFEPAKTGLVSLFLSFPKGAARGDFRKIVFRRK